MAKRFADLVLTRLRELLDRHDETSGGAGMAERLGRPRSWLHKRLQEPPRFATTLEDVDEILDALGEKPGVMLAAPPPPKRKTKE